MWGITKNMGFGHWSEPCSVICSFYNHGQGVDLDVSCLIHTHTHICIYAHIYTYVYIYVYEKEREPSISKYEINGSMQSE